MIGLEQKAKDFAAYKHRNQKRKVTGEPYIIHPEAVVNELKAYGIKDDDILSAAWLHDTYEDTDTTLDEIKKEFNPTIEYYVKVLSKNGKTLDEYDKGIVDSCFGPQIIKLADLSHNMQTVLQLPERSIRKEIYVCENYFIPLAERISPFFFENLKTGVAKCRNFLEANRLKYYWDE